MTQSVGQILENHPIKQAQISEDDVDNDIDSLIPNSNEEKEIKKGRGGARPNAGRPRGSIEPQTKMKHDAWKAYRGRVMKMTDRLLDTQTSLAFGIQLLFKIEEMVESETKLANGKVNRKMKKKIKQVEDPREIRAYIAWEEGIDDEDSEYDFDSNTYYFLTAKRPNLSALQDMLDRTYGKAPQELNTKHTAEGVLGQMMKKALDGRNFDEPEDAEIYEETIKTIEIEPEPEKTEPQKALQAPQKVEADTVVMEKPSEAQSPCITVSKKDILKKIEANGTGN